MFCFSFSFFSRNKLLTTFTTGKMRAIFPEIVASCQTLVNRDPKTLIKEDFTAFAVESFLNSMFGTAILPAGKDEMIRNCKTVFEGSGYRMSQQYGLTYFPKLSQYLNMTFMSNELHSYFSSLMHTLLTQRAKLDIGRNDYAQVLVDMKRLKKMTIFSRENSRENQEFGKNKDLIFSFYNN